MIEDEPLWTIAQVAEYLKLSVNTVARRRAGTWAIPRVMLGRRAVRYRPRDVRLFCERKALRKNMREAG